MTGQAVVSDTNENRLPPGITCRAEESSNSLRLGTGVPNPYIDAVAGSGISVRRTHHGDLRCPFSNTCAKIAGTNSRHWSGTIENRFIARSAGAITWRSDSPCQLRPRCGAIPAPARLRHCRRWVAAAPHASRACAAAADRSAFGFADFFRPHRPFPACRACLRRSDSSNFNGSDDYTRAAVRNGRTVRQPVWNSTGFRTMLLFAVVAPCCASFRETDSSHPRRPTLTPFEPRSRLRPMDKNRNRG